MARRFSRLTNAAVLLCTVLFLFVASEAALRAKTYLEDRELIESARDLSMAPLPPGADTPLGPMIQMSENRKIVYEMKPRLVVTYAGAQVSTNGWGFRSWDYPAQKPHGTVRVVGLGDSVMFGQGVSDGEHYMAHLEDLLGKRHPERKWEAVNTAAPGYNAVMEVEVLRDKGLAFRPDVVVVGFCDNDLSLPNFIREREEDYLTLKKSFLAEFVDGRLDAAIRSMEGFGLVHASRRELKDGQSIFEDRPEKVPPQYRDMVGWEAYERAMGELREMSQRMGFEVFVVYAEPYKSKTAERSMLLTGELGFTVVDAGPALRTFMEEQGIEAYRGSVLTVSSEDLHPSPVGHAIIAGEILKRLEEKSRLF